MPTPRFSTASSRAIRASAKRSRPAESDGTVTEEVVSVQSGGQYVVRGSVTPTRVVTQIKAGDTVTVLWKDGKPFLILDVRQRRGPGTDEVLIGGKIVETLFLVTDPETSRTEVWFRNDSVLADLELRAALPGEPDMVRWGAREDSFLVRVDGDKYFTYKFKRTGLDKPMRRAPQPKLLRPFETLSDNTTPICTGTISMDATFETIGVWVHEVVNFSASGPSRNTGPEDRVSTSAATAMLTRNASASQATPIDLSTCFVVDVQLDFEYSLVVAASLDLGGAFTLVRPSGTMPGVLDKSYFRFETPIGTIITETGDFSATDDQPDLGGTDYAFAGATPESDVYSLVVNVTKRKILWSTVPVSPVFAQTNVITRALQRAAHGELTDIGNEFQPPSYLSEFTENGATGSDDSPDLSSLQFGVTSPPLGIAGFPGAGLPTIPIDIGSVNVIETYDIPAANGVGFLGLASPTATHSDAIITRYRGSVSTIGHYSKTVDPVVETDDRQQTALQADIVWTRTYRAETLISKPLLYVPRRTKEGGDVFFWAAKLTQTPQINSPPPATFPVTSIQWSLWRVKTDGAATQVVAWTSGSSQPIILGASLRHVLYTVDDTVVLTDTESGDAKVLAAGGAAVTDFLTRSWWVLRPDLLYVLDGTDKKVKNQFILAWTRTMITLDPAQLKVDSTLRDVGSLKDLKTLTPDSAQFSDGLTSAHVIPSRGVLKSRFVKDP